jgi:hypothetical protein
VLRETLDDPRTVVDSGGAKGVGVGTVRLDERDCRPTQLFVVVPDVVTIAGDLGSGVRLIETPLINNVGDFGIPVSDSYSFELSVSNWRPLFVLLLMAAGTPALA